MELHQQSDVSPSQKEPNSSGWLTPEQKQLLHESAKECQQRSDTSEVCRNWRERFKEEQEKQGDTYKVPRCRR